MSWPYTWQFAVLCLVQGTLVAMGWRDERPLRRSRGIGVFVLAAALCIGLLLITASDVSREALATVATFGTPLAAAALGIVAAWHRPIISIVVSPILFVIAWRSDGLLQDAASVALVALAAVALAALIAAITTPRALAVGLLLLAIVDIVLVFRGHVAQPSLDLHAVTPPSAGGTPLPALQDATLGPALMGWLDLLAPACAGMLFVHAGRERWIAAVLTAVGALAWGLLLATTSPIPGTVPALVAVAVWMLLDQPPSSPRVHEPFNPLLAQQRRR